MCADTIDHLSKWVSGGKYIDRDKASKCIMFQKGCKKGQNSMWCRVLNSLAVGSMWQIHLQLCLSHVAHLHFG